MKSIFINDLGKGGAEKVVKGLAENSTEIDLIITIWPNFYNMPQSCKVESLLHKKSFLPLDLVLAFFRLIKYVRLNKISFVNSHLFWANYMNYFCSLITDHKVVMTHCVSFKSKFKNKFFAKIIHYLLCKITFRNKVSHIFKSIDMRAEYCSLFNSEKSVVMLNPVDLVDIKKKAFAEIEFEFKDEVTYFLCVGRFHKTKNQVFILRFLKLLPDFYNVIFIGEGEMLESCIAEAKNLGISKKVHFIGQISNPFPYYLKSDYYISASLSEGFPNALLEALSLGCIPFVFDCPTGPKEILTEFYTKKPFAEFGSIDVYKSGFLIKILNVDFLINDFFEALKYVSVLKDDRAHFISQLSPNKYYLDYDLFIRGVCEKS